LIEIEEVAKMRGRCGREGWRREEGERDYMTGELKR
jgi:hypothetical protein